MSRSGPLVGLVLLVVLLGAGFVFLWLNDALPPFRVKLEPLQIEVEAVDTVTPGPFSI